MGGFGPEMVHGRCGSVFGVGGRRRSSRASNRAPCWTVTPFRVASTSGHYPLLPSAHVRQKYKKKEQLIASFLAPGSEGVSFHGALVSFRYVVGS